MKFSYTQAYKYGMENGKSEDQLNMLKYAIGNKIKWTLYSLEGCGYCDDAKKLLEDKKQDFKYIKVKSGEEVKNLHKKLKAIIGDYEYFPIILKNGKFVGGLKELKEEFKNVIK